jgi:methenyltetrahydromethanopterin cyclohydrolase
MATGEGLNRTALDVFMQAHTDCQALGIEAIQLDCGTHLLDFGVHVRGGIQAGLQLASICLGGQANVSVDSGEASVWRGPWIQVATDHPIRACLFGQYAGWPVQSGKFFAMGSGPMRLRRGKEKLLQELNAVDSSPIAVGVLECDQLPSSEVALEIADQCQVAPESLWIAIAPTRSLAGCIQVVARSIETSLHKLYELGFPLSAIKNAYGLAPLPPPTPDFALGIGRTNDAILYGGHVTLWVDADDGDIQRLGSKVPSSHSADFGEPFADIFKKYEYDFYRVDPGLFSPAEIFFFNLRSGRGWRYGQLREDLLSKSFAVEEMG